MNIFHLTLSIILPLVLNLIFVPILITIANRYKLYDITDERKTHKGNIPRLGGIGFFISLLFSAIIIYLIIGSHISRYFYIALFVIFVSGVFDDFKPVNPIVKLLAQITATTILIIGGHTFSHIYLPLLGINLSLGFFQYPITFIWIIGATNALNLLDGMDGQAGGVTLIGSLTMGIIALLLGQVDIAIICFILSGGVIGFLRYNFPPAKIFMGDGGSLTSGFFISALPLIYSNPEIKGKVILVAIALLLIPILDVFAAMIRRSRKKLSFFVPDRGHIHHKFIDFTSLKTRQILSVIYGICILSGTLAVIFVLNTNLITEIGLFFNLFIHIFLFYFLHVRKVERSKI